MDGGISLWHLFAICHLNPIVRMLADSILRKSPYFLFIYYRTNQTISPFETLFLYRIVMLNYKYIDRQTLTHTHTVYASFHSYERLPCHQTNMNVKISIQFIFFSHFFQMIQWERRTNTIFSKDFHPHSTYILYSYICGLLFVPFGEVEREGTFCAYNGAYFSFFVFMWILNLLFGFA